MAARDHRWKVGLVGVGRGSGYGALFANSKECDVTACCDTSDAALARFQQELQLLKLFCF